MYQPDDEWRFCKVPLKPSLSPSPYRTPWRRDYARIIHSPSFRRLEGKTQLFPGNESDFFRNRLTHSLEVAQLAKDIAIQLNNSVPMKKAAYEINPDICEIAGLVHDLGHPPFGHNGEKALDDCMKRYGGFEGNAQTLRILLRLEKKERLPIGKDKDPYLVGITKSGKDIRTGLNLTARVLASSIKYDVEIPVVRKPGSKVLKGFYNSEAKEVATIKMKVLGKKYTGKKKFKTVECQIMDIADDIAYSTYDIEDAFKAGFQNPFKIISSEIGLLESIAKKTPKHTVEDVQYALFEIFGTMFKECIDTHQKTVPTDDEFYFEKTLNSYAQSYNTSNMNSCNGYKRNEFTSYFVDYFLSGIKIKIDKKAPQLSKVSLDPEMLFKVNVLKHFCYNTLISSSMLKVTEHRGYDIVTSIFNALADTKKEGSRLLPKDFQILYQNSKLKKDKMRVLCDFIAGMTDRYAVEFYSRLYSESPESIFKPI